MRSPVLVPTLVRVSRVGRQVLLVMVVPLLSRADDPPSEERVFGR